MENKVLRCCLCGNEFSGFGNNPQPIENDGRCCNACDAMFVTKARMLLADPRTKHIVDRQRYAKVFYLYLKDKYRTTTV